MFELKESYDELLRAFKELKLTSSPDRVSELENMLSNKEASIKVQLSCFLFPHTQTRYTGFSLYTPQTLQQQVRQLESEVDQLRHKLAQTETIKDKLSKKASELDREVAGVRLANSLLEQQVDSLQGELGVSELVQQDLNQVLKVVEDGVDTGALKVGMVMEWRSYMCVC